MNKFLGKKTPVLAAVAIALFLAFSGGRGLACSWAAFANGRAHVVARTMDWYVTDDAVVKGHGRNVAARAAGTPNAAEYRAKYASLQFHSFESGLVIEAMNEKGLQGSILFLEDSRLPEPKPDRKDVDPSEFISYAVSNFATVQEIIDDLDRINFIPAVMDIPGAGGEKLDYQPDRWPGHFAFADASGDKVIIEFIRHEVRYYHGPENDAMTNEPPYETHLAVDSLGVTPGGGIGTVERRARARNYMRDMRERGVDTQARALMAMRGLLASVTAGTEEIDRTEDEVYPTIWGVLADQNARRYYLSRYDTWCGEIYDFSMFDYTEPVVTALTAKDCPYEPLSTKSGE